MPLPTQPDDEPGRLLALQRFEILDTPPERALDEIAALAARICHAPIAFIALVDERRQWFKAMVGWSISEIPRDQSFCAHALAQSGMLIVPDATLDARFAENPLVTGEPGVRFYAAAPLLTADGYAVGTLAVVDREPRALTEVQCQTLAVLSRQIIAQFELRLRSRELAESEARLLEVFGHCPVAVAVNRSSDRRFVDVNDAFASLVGWPRAEILGKNGIELNMLTEDAAANLRGRLSPSGAIRDLETPIRTRSGDVRQILMGSVRVTLRGEPHVVTTFIDMTERKNAEDALRHSEAQFRAICDTSPVGIFLVEPDLRVTYGNPAGIGMTGLSGGSQQDWLTAVHPDDRDRVVDEWHASHESGTAYSGTGRFLHPDGRVVWWDMVTAPIGDADTGRGRVAMIVDITERRHAEARIEHLNRVYAVLTDINQAIVREKSSQALLFTACRVAVEKGGFGLAWIGLLDPITSRLGLVAHAGADAQTLEILTRLITADPPSGCVFTSHALREGEHGVCNDIARDPRALPWRQAALARGYRAMASFPLRAGGHVIGAFNLYAKESGFFVEDELRLLDELAVDVSFASEVHERELQRQQAERDLRASEERFREVVENIREVFWVVDPVHSQLLYVSPSYESVWGRTCASLYESPLTWLDGIHPQDRARVAAANARQTIAGEYDEVYRVIRPDGTMRWIRDRAFPIRDASGAIHRVVGTAEDVTEQRQLEEQFRQSQKMEAIGQLAGGVAHDFNNILAAIIMQVDLAAQPPDLPLATQGYLRDAKAAAERAARLTRQLLTFSRRQVMQSRILDLNEIVTGLTKMLQRIVGDDVQLQLSLHPRPLVTRADAGMIEQVLLNLVINARDAMTGGGRLFIETLERTVARAEAEASTDTAPGCYACIRVKDTGRGIPPENLSRVFEPFFTTKEAGKGTGLGLATAFGIVKQHNGSLLFQSDVGRGSTFEVLLPLADPKELVAVVPEPPKPKPRGGTETVLVVEDEPAVRRLTRIVLERHGYRVLEAADGVEALRVWDGQAGAIDLLLTDIVMPEGVDGRELARRLRAEKSRLRVIFTSGYSAEIAGLELSLLPGQLFLQKPSAPQDLLAAVRQCLDQ